MLGPRKKPALAAKAMETRGLVGFCVEMFEKHMDKIKDSMKLEAKLLQRTVISALEFNGHLGGSLKEIPFEKRNAMFNSYKSCIVCFERAGGYLTPKVHLMFHCLQRTKTKGHPSFYHTFADESLNGLIARIARSCHRLSWDTDILYKISISKRLDKPV